MLLIGPAILKYCHVVLFNGPSQPDSKANGQELTECGICMLANIRRMTEGTTIDEILSVRFYSCIFFRYRMNIPAIKIKHFKILGFFYVSFRMKARSSQPLFTMKNSVFSGLICPNRNGIQ